MKNRLGLLLTASVLSATPVAAQVVTLPILNTPSGKTLAGGSVPVDSSGVEKGTTGNPLVMSCTSGCSGGTYTGPSAAQLPASLGPKTGALSLSVVPNTDTAFPASQSGTWNITNISGTVSLPTGAATETTLSGMSGKLPASLGAKTGALSFSVVPNTDTAFPVSQATASSLNAQVVGNVASGSSDSGNGVKIAGVYSSTFSALTTGQRADLRTDQYGQPRAFLVAPGVAGSDGVSNSNLISGSPNNITGGSAAPLMTMTFVYNGSTFDRQRGDTNGTVTQPYAVSSSRWQYAAAAGGISNTTTAVTVATAAGAGIRNYVTAIECVTDGAMGAGSELAVRDGAAGTVMWRMYVGTGGILNGGGAYTFPAPLKGTANTLVEIVTLTAQVTGKLYCNLQGFTGA